MKKIYIMLCFCFPFLVNAQLQNIQIIPQASEIKNGIGHFTLTKSTIIVLNNAELKQEAEFLNQYLLENYGFSLKIEKSLTVKKNFLLLGLSKEQSQWIDAYKLTVLENSIEIWGDQNAGVFYGLQSLFQLMPLPPQRKISIPSCNISDYARFTWRGMHLDCSRHFFSPEFIKKYIDNLAFYKMNVFHWHLTDDQGWRIEIKKYPLLTEIGGYRNGSMIGHYRDQKFDTIRYGGYYTQEQIKEIVAYAAARHVTIVPEIEMPGHALAALAAYPQFSCTGKKLEVGKRWGVEEEVYCPSEETFAFLNEVLGEVINLFPGKYIHIGGDEVLKNIWDSSALCQQIMAKEKHQNSHELQSYFIRRIEQMVNARGRQIIGWDEILEGGLAPNAAVMSWRGIEGGIAAAKQKHFVVMTPGGYCYFDHYQGKPEQEPLAIGGFTPLEKTYSYEPIPDTLNAEEAKYILGAQGNVWTEYIYTEKQVEYMAFPRLIALAEVNWSAKNVKDYQSFYNRLNAQRPLLQYRKINFSESAFKK